MRKIIFKNLQKLRKGKFFEHIAFMEANYGVSFTLNDQSKYEKFINHAINTTPYYQDYRNYKTLEACPLITKETVKENYDDFLSTKYKQADLVEVLTSGSYGTPFTFLFTKEKKELQRAEIIYFSKWANYDVGKRHGLITAKPGKSPLIKFMQNQVAVFPVRMTEEELEKEIKLIKAKKLKFLIGYSSIIDALAKQMIANDDYYKFEGIVAISELLTESARKNIKKAFGVTPLSRYTTEEMGVLAMECPQEQKHHLNNVNYIIEVLDENGLPVQPGEQGEVVVTDLNSHAMPLIRYKTGDLVILGEGKCKCGLETPYIESLVGRVLEVIYTTDGKIASSFAIIAPMVPIEGVRQYQFIQTGEKEYTLNIIKLIDYIEELDIIRQYKAVLGEDAKIIFNYVEDIPPLKSGKRPQVLQKYYKGRLYAT